MSKVDAQRAMKAARHARTPAAAAPPPAPRTTAPPAHARTAARDAATATAGGTPVATPPAPAAAAVGLCGHRNMAGKECRRAAGHAEKSHRYG